MTLRRTCVIVAVLWGVTASAALGRAQESGLFPPAHQVFEPLRADPRELQYALRAVVPVSRTMLGEAAIGDYLGLYYWDLEGDAGLQVSVGGGVFGRFELASAGNDMQAADFYGNLPLDWHHGRWSGRFMLFHTSSHLGDDLLAETGQTTTKHAWDNMRWLTAYRVSQRLRIYGGYTYVFRTLPAHLGRNAFQGGFELESAPCLGQHARLYWANDFQTWQRNAWNPMFNSQAGIRLNRSPEMRRGVSIFIEYSAGDMPHGQFFQNKESRWNFGVKFDLS